MSQGRSFALYQLPAIIWGVAIFGLSALPGIGVVRIPVNVDKIIHAVIYLVLCLLVWRALYYQAKFPNLQKRAILAAFLFTLAYGALDEFHQIYVPGRTPDPMDVVADGTGSMVVVLVLTWRYWKQNRSKTTGTFDKS
jgi:VanZ family protein